MVFVPGQMVFDNGCIGVNRFLVATGSLLGITQLQGHVGQPGIKVYNYLIRQLSVVITSPILRHREERGGHQ